MGGALKFFLNAIKALVFSPFYLIYFALYAVIVLINYVLGEIKFLITGFKYGKKKENKYQRKLMTINGHSSEE